MAKSIGYGEQLTKMDMNWISWYNSRRNTSSALRFFKKLLKNYEQVPRVMITDKLASYAAAKAKILKGVEHRQHKGLNNKIEVAHEPTRLREKQMRKFHSPRHAQKFLSKFGILKNFFKVGLYKLSAQKKRERLTQAFEIWNQIVLQESYV